MRSRLAAAFVAVSILSAPAPAAAWGFPAHRYITEQALALLPTPLRAFFESRKAFVVERSIDPDLWRNAGFEQEAPNHFLDFGYAGYGPFPFTALPRDYDEAVRVFGPEVVREQGLVPWRTAEFHGRLRRAFEELKKPNPGYALDNIAFYAAALAHYVGDAHVPFHATINYDGQLTDQRGIHSRFESDLFDRLHPRLQPPTAASTAVTAPRDRIFAVLLDGYQLVDPVLAADRAATTGREFYDDGYFAAFATGAGPVLERRVRESIAEVAAFIAGAWEQAGRPAVPVELARSPRRIPRR